MVRASFSRHWAKCGGSSWPIRWKSPEAKSVASMSFDMNWIVESPRMISGFLGSRHKSLSKRSFEDHDRCQSPSIRQSFGTQPQWPLSPPGESAPDQRHHMSLGRMIGSRVVVRDSTTTRQLIGPRNFCPTRWRWEWGKTPVALMTTSTSMVSVFPEPLPPPTPTTRAAESWTSCARAEAGR